MVKRRKTTSLIHVVCLLNSCSGPGSLLGTEDTKMRTSCLFNPQETLVRHLPELCVLGSHVKVNADSGVFSLPNFNSLGWAQEFAFVQVIPVILMQVVH